MRKRFVIWKFVIRSAFIFLLLSFIFLGGCFGKNDDSSGSSIDLTPAAPSGLTLRAISSTIISLSWIDNSTTEIGFYVEHRQPPATFTRITTLPAGITSYTHTGLASNSTHYYRVQAYNYQARSSYSNEMNMLTSWGTMQTTGTPLSRTGHSAIWVDNYGMIIWGGYTPVAYLMSGSVYSPTDNSWSNIIAGAPEPRINHTAIWTGSKMIVWGGEWFNAISDTNITFNTGGIYDPSIPSWTDIFTDAASPVSRTGHSAVWTGSVMIIWGGGGGDGTSYRQDGYYFDTSINRWFFIMPTTGAPAARKWHTAVFTGSGSEEWRHKMIIWGGYSGSYLNSGSSYHMQSELWFSLPLTTNTPSARCKHTVVWTGSKMIIWGGYNGIDYLNTGAIYDPASNTWTAMSTVNAPSGRVDHTAIWTGSKMIIWGGGGAAGFDTGGIYDPATDTWQPTTTIDAPTRRGQHVAVWTGSEMLIWGGWNGMNYFNTGGRYKIE